MESNNKNVDPHLKVVEEPIQAILLDTPQEEQPRAEAKAEVHDKVKDLKGSVMSYLTSEEFKHDAKGMAHKVKHHSKKLVDKHVVSENSTVKQGIANVRPKLEGSEFGKTLLQSDGSFVSGDALIYETHIPKAIGNHLVAKYYADHSMLLVTTKLPGSWSTHYWITPELMHTASIEREGSVLRVRVPNGATILSAPAAPVDVEIHENN